MKLFASSRLSRLVMIFALSTTPAIADCVTTCVDSDGGIDAEHAGSVELTTRCGEGDNLDQFPDQCVGTGSLLEYSCNRTTPDHETVAVTRIACSNDCTAGEYGLASCIKVENPPTCMKPVCPPPPPGCKYGPPKKDSNGCPIDCGMLVCSDPNPPNPGNPGNPGNPPNPGNNGNNGKKKPGKSKGGH